MTLQNGTVLRKGTIFSVVIAAANLSCPSLDEPGLWNGHRYHELRKQDNFSNRASSDWEWGAARPDDMNFGHGSHQCPARFAGPAIVKLFTLKFLSVFEIQLEVGATERYPDVHSAQYVSVYDV
jgi:hypothetical protein